MPPTSPDTNLQLGQHFETFITQRLEDGRYESASEVVRAALRLLEDQEAKLTALRKALIDGEQSGHADYALDTFLQKLDA